MSFTLNRTDSPTCFIGVVTGFAVGFCSHAILRWFRPPSLQIENFDDDDDFDDSGWAPAQGRAFEEHKLVLCVRTDLKMQKGKIAAQVGHATLGAYKAAMRRNKEALQHWERNAQPKIALQVSSHAEARRLENEARARGLVTFMVHDAGRTQIAAVSLTNHKRSCIGME